MKFWRCSLIFLSVLAINGCKNDLHLNAPYKEIPTIYAVLNPFEAEQVIRINKLFLGEGDANQMAKVSDSINYPENELTVMLERYIAGKRVQVSYKDTAKVAVFSERMIESSPGAFSTQQRVYVLSDSLFPEGEYRLTVKNNHTGNIFRAKATALKNVEFAYFSPLNNQLPFPYPLTTPAESPYYIDYSVTSSKNVYEIRYHVDDAYVYQLIIRMVLIETRDGASYERYIDYNGGTRSQKDFLKLPFNGSYVSHTFTGGGIYDAVANEIRKDKYSVVGRKLYRMDYFVYSSTREYFDYLEYQKPSLSINQSKPLYSNFEDGAALGIFTFRTSRKVSLQPKAAYVSSFSDNPSTCQYNFYDFSDKIRGCR